MEKLFPEDEEDDEPSMTESTLREVEAMGLKGPFFLGGKQVKVVPDADAREMTIICLPWGISHHFADDVKGTCSRCGTAVHHRPHIPLGSILVCSNCYKGKWTLSQMTSK